MISSAPSARPQFGHWSFDLGTETWHWSAEVIAMWDIGLTTDTPVDAVVLRLHPDDRDEIGTRLTAAVEHGVNLSGQGRLLTDSLGERIFAFFGDVVHDECGGRRLQGYSLDVTEEMRAATREAVDAATRHRRAIEQVKGALMVTYCVDEVTAFAILRKQSNESNVKIHQLADEVSRVMSSGSPRPDGGATPMMEILTSVARRLRAPRPTDVPELSELSEAQ